MNNRRVALSEVYSFVNSLSFDDYNKISNDVIEYINWHRDYNYKFNYDSTKPIKEQNFSREAIAIIVKIFLKYFANADELQKAYGIIYKNEQKKNIKLTENYNPDDIFKNRDNGSETVIKDNLPIEIEKGNFFKRFIDNIKNLFLKKD